ncbi:hypothetical protein RHSIM_RhsimUnG0205200 [Rhododendron simsii]|uniref:RNase H type-1 domain-containing protein n=1 Tax=Rhododendron simsii TaxID=118357 RepID=A0A834FUA0_RHOSS|nr:hypothetical protein RHSIM_RhsimUnG0205200 [Rhododendron simsii]
MGSLKALGPDGFPGVFFQKYWDQVKDSVCSMVKDFFEGSANIEKLNKTNVVLIPKIPHPETVSQFRPISLCNFGYKIISKVDISHGRIKVSSALAAEAWAVRIAVLMAKAWGLQRATIETDCEVLVHLLQAASNHKNWSIQAITDDILAKMVPLLIFLRHSACNLQDKARGGRGNKEQSGDESQERRQEFDVSVEEEDLICFELPQILAPSNFFVPSISPNFLHNMAVSLPEHWACVDGNDHDFNQFEVQEIDGALLMSLLEEPNAEDCDNGQLTSVIRSLEAEIDPDLINGDDLSMELGWGADSEGFQPFDAAQVNGLDFCSIAHDLDDFDWMEVEMIPPSSPSNEMNNWYMDPCGDELDGIIGFGDFSNMYYGVPLEELAYGSLWQETHDAVMQG